MRACFLLLVASVALFASSNGSQVTSTSPLLASNTVPSIDDAQAVDTGKRFLRSFDTTKENKEEDDESEERTIKLPAGLLKAENLKADDLLNKNILDHALMGNKRQRNKLFGQWSAAPQNERFAAIKYILSKRGGFTTNKKFFNAWNKFSGRLDGGVTRKTAKTITRNAGEAN